MDRWIMALTALLCGVGGYIYYAKYISLPDPITPIAIRLIDTEIAKKCTQHIKTEISEKGRKWIFDIDNWQKTLKYAGYRRGTNSLPDTIPALLNARYSDVYVYVFGEDDRGGASFFCRYNLTEGRVFDAFPYPLGDPSFALSLQELR
jgi:hypothetical protein